MLGGLFKTEFVGLVFLSSRGRFTVIRFLVGSWCFSFLTGFLSGWGSLFECVSGFFLSKSYLSLPSLAFASVGAVSSSRVAVVSNSRGRFSFSPEFLRVSFG